MLTRLARPSRSERDTTVPSPRISGSCSIERSSIRRSRSLVGEPGAGGQVVGQRVKGTDQIRAEIHYKGVRRGGSSSSTPNSRPDRPRRPPEGPWSPAPREPSESPTSSGGPRPHDGADRLAGGAALAAERGPRGPIRADFEAKVRGDNESVSAKRHGFIGLIRPLEVNGTPRYRTLRDPGRLRGRRGPCPRCPSEPDSARTEIGVWRRRRAWTRGRSPSSRGSRR